jgi:hypothetical protein
MSIAYLNDRSRPLLEKQIRAELDYLMDVDKFLENIDRQPGLYGAGILYFNGMDGAVIREFQPLCQSRPINIIIRSAPRGATSATSPVTPKMEEENEALYSSVVEHTSTVLSCSAAILSWLVVFGSGAASVPTLGASAPLTVLSYAAASASTAQCFIGGYRSSRLIAGREDRLEWLDSQEWYQKTSAALDLVSLAGAGASYMATIKTYKALKAAGNQSLTKALSEMPRAERKRLTEEIIRASHPGISNVAVKAYLRAGVYPKRYGQAEISLFLKKQLVDAVAATMGFTGSALAGVIRNPSRIHDLVFGISIPLETI